MNKYFSDTELNLLVSQIQFQKLNVYKRINAVCVKLLSTSIQATKQIMINLNKISMATFKCTYV